MPLALDVDHVWTKKRIMEVYLNIAEWAPGIYGIEAAARYHFGTTASKVDRRQAALLAVTLPDPERPQPEQARPASCTKLAAHRRARARGSGDVHQMHLCLAQQMIWLAHGSRLKVVVGRR